VQLSDFHYDGLRLSEEMLEQARCNQAEPDLVLLTGDYVTDNPADSQAGTTTQTSAKSFYAVLGNHDIYFRWSKEGKAALSSIGIHVLWNEIAYPLGQGLPLVGLLTIGRASSK